MYLTKEHIIPNIVAYHVNDIDRCNKFVDDEKYLIFSKDKSWLGLGMYFWDNTSNAIYWLKQKKRKDKKKETFICVKCNLILKENIVLDITDKKTANKIDEMWTKYISKNETHRNEKRIGVKLDILFRILPRFKEYSIVKAHATYPKDNQIEFFESNYDTCHISSNIKTIYLAKTSDVVVNREKWRLNHEN